MVEPLGSGARTAQIINHRLVSSRGGHSKVVPPGQADVGLDGHADDALEWSGLGGQSKCFDCLSREAAGEKEIDSQTHPPLAEGPKHGRA